MVVKKDSESDVYTQEKTRDTEGIKDNLEVNNQRKNIFLGAKKISDKKSASLVKGWSIRTKATILSTLFGALPVLLVGVISYEFVNQIVSQQISAEKRREAEQISGQIDQFLTQGTANVKTVANIVTTLTPNVEQLSSEQKRLVKITLSEIYRDYQIFESLALYDAQGNVLVQSEGSLTEKNQAENSYFQTILTKKNLIISEPTVDEYKDDLAIYIGTPISNKTGKIVAVLTGEIPVDNIGAAILKTASLRKGTTYRLIDGEGKIFQSILDIQKLPLGTKIITQLPLFEQINKKRTTVTWEESSLNAYAPISTNVNLNWSLVTSTDKNIAFAAQQKLGLAITLGTVITAIVAAIFGAIIANRITKPIVRITETVEKLTEGQLDIRVAVKGTDELAILGDNINKMAAEIQTLLATLRRNSQELEQQNQVLANLAKNEALIQGDTSAASQAFTEAIANTLAIERVSIWLYNADRTILNLLDLYEQNNQKHSADLELKQLDFSEYFQLLAENRPILGEDAQSKTATSEQTNSILDQPIQVAGQTVGIIRCEQINEHTWTPQEQNFVGSVANLVTLAVESESLQGEIGNILEIVSSVEEGDFTVRANVSDRATGLVADILNRLIEELAQVLQQVLGTAQEVSQGAGNLEAIAKIVAENAEQQAESVTQVLTLSEEVETSAQNSASEVKTTNQSLFNLRETLSAGQQTITKLTQGIEVLQQGTDRIIRQMKTLGEFVGLADQFVQEQGEIVQQTQVLALNASLVAARAAEQKDPRRFGEVAREFEGIADQVGKLATQTDEGLAALQARTAQIHQVVSTIDIDIQSLGGLVDGFTQGVQQSDQIFNDVQSVTQQTIEAGEAVANLGQEIDNVTQKTTSAMRDIAVFAQETAQLTQNTLSQSEGIDSLSSRLLTLVKFFKLPENNPPGLGGKIVEVNSPKI